MAEEPSGDPTVFGPREVAPADLPTVTRDGLVVTTSAGVGGHVTVRVAGELLQETRPTFTEAVADLAGGTGPQVLVVDLTATTFMDSTGLGTLVSLRNEVVHRGGAFRLVRPEERVFRLFEITRLVELFEFVDEA